MSADQLDRALEGVGRSSRGARQQLMTMAGASVAFQGLQSALSGLQSTVNSLSSAWQVQIEAETKLQTVMRQRMAATEDDIKSIKELCSAQQQLGIIGDEVQLAGAQQLSTFLTQRSTLETLIPAMNNLVAQQKGYNATSQDATTVANLLGKAMQGQATALRRVGISFTAAQEAALKNGTESERAAMLARIITDNVGDMNAALAATPTGKMKQLDNALGDIKEQWGQLAVKIQPVLSVLSSALATMSQIGMTVTGVIAGGNALKSMLGSLTASLRTTTASMKAARVAALGLKGALGAVALVALAAVIKGITVAWEQATTRARQYAEVQKVAERHANDLRRTEEKGSEARVEAMSQIEQHIAKLKEFNGSKEQERKLVDEMNNTYSSTMGYYASVNGWLEALTKNAEAYCDALSYQIQLQEVAASMAAIRGEQYELDYNADGTKKTFSTDKPVIHKNGLGAMYTGFGAAINARTEYGLSEQEVRDQKAAALQRQLDELTAKRDSILKNMGGISLVTGSATSPTWDDKPVPMQLPERMEDFTNLAQFDELLKRLGQQRLTAGRYEIDGIDEQIQKAKELRDIFERTGRAYANRGTGAATGIKGALQLPSSGAAPVEIEKVDLSAWVQEWRRANEEVRRDTVDAVSAINTAWSSIGGIESGIRSITGALDEDATAWQRVSGIIGGSLQVLNAIGAIMPLINTLITTNTAVDTANAAAKQAGIAAQRQATTATIAGAAANTMEAHASIPFAGIAIAGGLIAAMIATMFALPKFAKGGIAYGPTLGLFGEYSGASTNPEVVAPLDRLRSILEPQGIGGDVRFVIRGDVLEGVLNRRAQKMRRS